MAKRSGPPARGPKDRGGEEPAPDEPGEKPGAPGPQPPEPGLDESRASPPPDDLTESTAVVFMTESDVVRLDSSASGEGAPPPPAQGEPKKPVPKPGAPDLAAPKRSGPPRIVPAKAAAPPPPERRSILPVVLGVLLGVLLSGAGGYALLRSRDAEHEEERDALRRKVEEVREDAKGAEARLDRALQGQLAAKEDELRRAREETAAARRATEEVERNAAAERRRIEDDHKANEQTLEESLDASREAEVKQVEKRERERAARERLDLERRARETIERFQALVEESERRRAAEEDVLRKEARAEVLRREAVLRKQFEEEKIELEAEKEKAIELESQKLEERLRAELETERGGFIHGGDEGGGALGEGIDLEAEVWEHLKGHLAGSAEYKLFEALRDSDQPEAKRWRNEGVFKLRYDLKFLESFEALVEPRVRVDDNGLAQGAQDGFEERQLHRPVFTLEEGWLQGRFGSFDLRLGKQIFAFGTGDIVNPSDVLNPVDYTDLIDSDKIGVPAADASYYLGESTRLRLVLVPTFTPSRLPLPGHRFGPFPPDGVFVVTPLGPIGPVPFADREFPPRTPHDAQVAARASTTVEVLERGFDLSGTYWYGWQRLPVITIDPRPDPLVPIELTPRYDRIHMLAADLSTTLWELELHGEGAAFLTEGDRDDDFFQFVLGGRYTRGDLVLAKDELRFILEYAGEEILAEATDENSVPTSSFGRAFKNAILARLAYKPINQLEFQTTSAVILKGPANMFLQPQASYELGSHTKIKAGFDLWLGREDSFFGAYRKEDRFWLSLKLSF